MYPKSVLSLILCASFVFSTQSYAQEQGDREDLRAISYNIRYDNPEDGIHNWHLRKDRMQQFLTSENPDVFGIQEGMIQQVQYLDSALVDYSYVGVGRNDGMTEGEYTAIFYDTTKMSLVASGTFWLSQTPEKPSKGWDAALPRICTYARFLRNGKSLLVLNTHFDHRGEKARIESAKLIVEKIAELNDAGHPIILMGDFNLTPESHGIQWIATQLEDYGDQLNPDPQGTWCSFEAGGVLDRRIDYIFTKNLSVSSYRHLVPQRLGGHHLSDHLPVLAEVSF